jgi:hypothetical protein
LFFNLQFYNNLDSWGDIHCTLGHLKKEEIECVLLKPLRILQMRRAFIAAFTSEKLWMTLKKSLFRHWPLTPNFFLAHL